MSGALRYNNPELQQSLAIAYTTGLLRGLARQRFERLRIEYPALDKLVYQYAENLQPLAETVPAVQPDKQVWQAIETRINPTTEQTSFWDKLSFWRGLTLASTSFSILFLCTTFYFVYQNHLFSESLLENKPYYVGILQDKDLSSSIAIFAKKDPFRLSIKWIKPVQLKQNESLQLWAIAKDETQITPVTTLSNEEISTVALSKPMWDVFKNTEQLMITIEQSDGVSVPSKRIIAKGLCVNIKS